MADTGGTGAGGQGVFDPFVVEGTDKLPPKIMASDHQGHSTNMRLKIDPRVHAKLSKMVAMRQVPEESVTELARSLMAVGLNMMDGADFELTNLMRVQAGIAKIEDLKATEAASSALVENLRVVLRESDGAVRDEYLMAALETYDGLSPKWQVQMDEVLHPYRAYFDQG